MVLAVLLALVVGCWAALKPNGIADRISSFVSMAAASIPDFWLAIVGIWVFAITLGWLPTSGVSGAGVDCRSRPCCSDHSGAGQIVRGSMVSHCQVHQATRP
jgi:peptide/nickel transport system permease protein